jgi:hypothetical protein
MPDWEAIARHLFSLLDDCDTADDIAKENDKVFRSLVRQAHRQRFQYQSLFDPEGDVSAFNQPPQEAP